MASIQQRTSLVKFARSPRTDPPGIVLEYARKSGEVETKAIDLLNLTPDTDVEVVINQIAYEERLISESKKPVLRKIIYKLLEKLENKDTQRYYEYKVHEILARREKPIRVESVRSRRE